MNMTQKEALTAVADGNVVYMMGSPIKGMSKTSYYVRTDTQAKVTATLKKLREAGMVRVTGRRSGMAQVVELTQSGLEALS